MLLEVETQPWPTRKTGLPAGARGWAVEFSADAIGEPGSDTALLSWYANPLLYPFVRPAGEEQVHRFSVPEADRPEWSRHLKALGGELEARRVGHQEAARAHLTLILVEVARLAEDVAGGCVPETIPCSPRSSPTCVQQYR